MEFLGFLEQTFERFRLSSASSESFEAFSWVRRHNTAFFRQSYNSNNFYETLYVQIFNIIQTPSDTLDSL